MTFLLSLGFGLLAIFLPFLTIFSKKMNDNQKLFLVIISFTACAIAIYLQIEGIAINVHQSQLVSLMDTIDGSINGARALIFLTLLGNGFYFVKKIKTSK